MSAQQYIDKDFFEVTGGIFKNIKESWEAIKLNFLTFVLLYLVPIAVGFIALPFVLLPALTGSDVGTAAAVLLAFFVFVLLLIVLLVFLPAITITQLASVKGEKLEFGVAFEKGKKYVLRYIGLGLLSALIILCGLILFIIPGILAAFFLCLSPYLLVDKNLGVTDSMKESYELTKKYWKPVLAVGIVYVAINIPSYIPIIGGIVSIVLSIAYFCLPAYVYSVITGKKVIKAA